MHFSISSGPSQNIDYKIRLTSQNRPYSSIFSRKLNSTLPGIFGGLSSSCFQLHTFGKIVLTSNIRRRRGREKFLGFLKILVCFMKNVLQISRKFDCQSYIIVKTVYVLPCLVNSKKSNRFF